MADNDIVGELLKDDGARIRRYFDRPAADSADPRVWTPASMAGKQGGDRWVADFRKRSAGARLDHDEPWLTLVALFGLFGDQRERCSAQHLAAVNRLFERVYSNREGGPEAPRLDVLTGVQLEVGLRENRRYRDFLRRTLFAPDAYHPYADRRRRIEARREKGSLEGSTYVDAIISGENAGKTIHVFIEAKFLSDISNQITYLPVRNQLSRNIDCIIDTVTDGGKEPGGIHDFWFVLLTPGVFRIDEYGGACKSPIECFWPTRSRLYCYKMLDYLQPEELRRDLPHVNMLDEKQWQDVSRRIGWMTYEEIVETVINKQLLEGSLLAQFRSFFAERQLRGDCS